MILYSYYRSSASYRVRIALNLKQISYEYRSVHLLKNGGEQHSAEYSRLNPMKQVPSLIVDGRVLTQSMAIIDFLDAKFEKVRLFPKDPWIRAQIISFCENINAGMQPLQNLRTLQDLEEQFKATQEDKNTWTAQWLQRGFKTLETILEKNQGPFSFGTEPTAADCFLVPQVFAAKRFNFDFADYPRIRTVYDHCIKQPAFIKAHPAHQVDTPSGEFPA